MTVNVEGGVCDCIARRPALLAIGVPSRNVDEDAVEDVEGRDDGMEQVEVVAMLKVSTLDGCVETICVGDLTASMALLPLFVIIPLPVPVVTAVTAMVLVAATGIGTTIAALVKFVDAIVVVFLGNIGSCSFAVVTFVFVPVFVPFLLLRLCSCCCCFGGLGKMGGMLGGANNPIGLCCNCTNCGANIAVVDVVVVAVVALKDVADCFCGVEASLGPILGDEDEPACAKGTEFFAVVGAVG